MSKSEMIMLLMQEMETWDAETLIDYAFKVRRKTLEQLSEPFLEELVNDRLTMQNYNDTEN